MLRGPSRRKVPLESFARCPDDATASVEKGQAVGECLRHHGLHPPARFCELVIRDVRVDQDDGIISGDAFRIQSEPPNLRRRVTGVDAGKGLHAPRNHLGERSRHGGRALLADAARGHEVVETDAIDGLGVGAVLTRESPPRLVHMRDARVPIHAHDGEGCAIELPLNPYRLPKGPLLGSLGAVVPEDQHDAPNLPPTGTKGSAAIGDRALGSIARHQNRVTGQLNDRAVPQHRWHGALRRIAAFFVDDAKDLVHAPARRLSGGPTREALRDGIQAHDAALQIGHDHAVPDALECDGQIFAASLQLVLRLLSGCDVSHGGDGHGRAPALDGAQSDLHRKLLAVLALPDELEAPSHRSHRGAREIPSDVLAMPRAEALRKKRVETVARELRSRVTEYPLHLCVDERDAPESIQDDHRVGRGVEHVPRRASRPPDSGHRIPPRLGTRCLIQATGALAQSKRTKDRVRNCLHQEATPPPGGGSAKVTQAASNAFDV